MYSETSIIEHNIKALTERINALQVLVQGPQYNYIQKLALQEALKEATENLQAENKRLFVTKELQEFFKTIEQLKTETRH